MTRGDFENLSNAMAESCRVRAKVIEEEVIPECKDYEQHSIARRRIENLTDQAEVWKQARRWFSL